VKIVVVEDHLRLANFIQVGLRFVRHTACVGNASEGGRPTMHNSARIAITTAAAFRCMNQGLRAQTAEPPDTGEPTVQAAPLETVTVTGSLIPASPDAVAVPIRIKRMPPLAPHAFLDNSADVSTFSPIGRAVYGTLAVKF
jgi:hypothetical protein